MVWIGKTSQTQWLHGILKVMPLTSYKQALNLACFSKKPSNPFIIRAFFFCAPLVDMVNECRQCAHSSGHLFAVFGGVMELISPTSQGAKLRESEWERQWRGDVLLLAVWHSDLRPCYDPPAPHFATLPANKHFVIIADHPWFCFVCLFVYLLLAINDNSVAT